MGGELDGSVLGSLIINGIDKKGLGYPVLEIGSQVVVDHAMCLLNALALAAAGNKI